MNLIDLFVFITDDILLGLIISWYMFASKGRKLSAEGLGELFAAIIVLVASGIYFLFRV